MTAFHELVRVVDPRRSAFGSLALVALVYLLTLGGLARSEFWIGDNSVKFLQVEAILSSHGTDFSLPWPGRALDRDYRYNPLPAPFSSIRQGKLYPTFPPAFAAISSLPYRWFGPAGLYLLPLLCSVLALSGVAALASETGAGVTVRHGAVLMAGLGTPVWFYAVEFWEHALALCGGIWAIRFCWRYVTGGRERDLVAVGLLVAGGTWFREETLLLAAVLMLLVLLETPQGKARASTLFAVSLAAGLLPLLIFQQWAIGRAFGFHVQNVLPSISAHLASRGEVLYRSLVAAGPDVGLSLLLGGPFLLCFLRPPRFSPPAFRVALPLAGLAALAAALFARHSAASLSGDIARLMSSNSLFPAAPVLALSLVRRRASSHEGPSDRFLDWLHKIALGFALLDTISAPSISAAGIHWGNRYLLVVYPLLAVVAAANLRAWFDSGALRATWLALPLVLAVALSFTAQVGSIQLLHAKKDFSAEVRRELARHAERAIATDVWWAPQELFSAFYDRPIFFVQTPAQMNDLTAVLRRSGFDRVLFVSSAARRLPYPGVQTVSDGSLGYFSLSFLGLDLP